MSDVMLLLDQLDSDDIAIYLKARMALIQMGSVIMPRLAETMLTRPDRLGWRVALVLAEMADEAVIPAFIQALQSPSSLVRQAAAQGLGQYQDRRVIATLINALSDPDPMVQTWVVESLSKLEARAAAKPLLALLQRTDSTALQAVIISALGRMGDASAAAALTPFLNSTDRHVRSRAHEVYEQFLKRGAKT
jgi:HEAT repeat protein